MALLPINSDETVDPGSLRAALGVLPEGAPIVVMIHGFKFTPQSVEGDPHRHILSLRPETDCWKAVSWPRHLGLAGDRGLALAYGWAARGSIWEAYRAAEETGARLATLLRTLRLLAPERPVHIIAHSLGARVALSALQFVPAGAVRRLILISPADFRSEARAAISTPAGRAAEVFAVAGRENALFDWLLRLALPCKGTTLGGAHLSAPNWLVLPLDRPAPLAALRGLGYRISAPRSRVCHWSGYLRPGVWSLYRALLLAPERTPMPLLRAAVSLPTRGRGAVRLRLPLPFGSERPS